MSEKDDLEPPRQAPKTKTRLPKNLQWIQNNWTWSKIKPAIRCTVAGWVSALLFIIPRVQIYMGQAAFVILIAAFLTPPSEPFLAVLEQEVISLLCICTAWAWACLGMFLAHLTRVNSPPDIGFIQSLSGEYIEAAPTVILGVFIFVGTFIILYIRARQGPGPFLFAAILGCIVMDIGLTAAVFTPFPFYAIGQAVVMPVGFHACVALLASIFVFPSTISAQFTTRFQAVLSPLVECLDLHRELLRTTTASEDFPAKATKIMEAVHRAEAAITPLASSGRLLENDIIYNRFAPNDFLGFLKLARRMVVRVNGTTTFFTMVDPTRERFPSSPMASRPATRPPSPISEKPPVVVDGQGTVGPSSSDDATKESPISPIGTLRDSPVGTPTPGTPIPGSPSASSHHKRHFFRLGHHGHHHSRESLLHLHLNLHIPRLRPHEHLVSVFESNRYADIEATHFNDPDSEEHTRVMVELLAKSCDPLLKTSRDVYAAVQAWLDGVRHDRFKGRQHREKLRQENIKKFTTLRDALAETREQFINSTRLVVLDPYRPALEDRDGHHSLPHHRYLFHSYVYQYHLGRVANMGVEMMDEVIRLETTRVEPQLWTAFTQLQAKLSTSNNNNNVQEQGEDEDPDIIPGCQKEFQGNLDLLGQPRRRDPDALPPKNAFEWIMTQVYWFFRELGGGNAMFALKAAILTTLLCLPSLLSSSAVYAYENRFVWAIFMGQLTLSRFHGDTTFGLIARVGSTFAGSVVGMLIWYISSGSSHGSPYGLAAVLGVCFPFFFYTRLYWNIHPMTNIIFFVTTILVVCYSYQNGIIFLPGSPGIGWEVAWRRCVLVTAGVTAAFLFSLIPPAQTLREYQRSTLATTTREIGSVYCAVLSYTSHKERDADKTESEKIVTKLVAIRSKLTRLEVFKANVLYEYTLRGRWPAERYTNILDLQLQILIALGQLMSVIENLSPSWTNALVKRGKFKDSSFQGDVLAVISMISTALRTGTPLPQITPCPLLDRWLDKALSHDYHQGLSAVRMEETEDLGIAKTLNLEMLEDKQYSIFCVGVATMHGIVRRLDRLMHAVKLIVGEEYHISGIGVGFAPSRRQSASLV